MTDQQRQRVAGLLTAAVKQDVAHLITEIGEFEGARLIKLEIEGNARAACLVISPAGPMTSHYLQEGKLQEGGWEQNAEEAIRAAVGWMESGRGWLDLHGSRKEKTK